MKFIEDLKKLAKTMMENTSTLVGMNSRNLDYIYPNNRRKHFPLADDKLKTKALLASKGLSTPATYAVYRYFYELDALDAHIKEKKGFVIKPAQGSGGNGIMVIVDKKGDRYITAGNKEVDLQAIKKHIGDILFGVHSMGMNDVAILEERLIQHQSIEALSPDGLADIRIICYENTPAIAMIRVATKASDGKANLHQGGIGIALDMQRGITTNAQIKRKNITCHPDTNENLLGLDIPHWDRIIQLSRDVAINLPLKYLGIDIAITQEGPVVLEVNVRPGIEIQNINEKGLRPMLEKLR